MPRTQTPTRRQSAEERREAVVTAALAEFAAAGLHGTSTETIAARAGISQPYLFRLFGTKKELFVAAVERCLAQTLQTFESAADGVPQDRVFEAMGRAYGELLGDRQRLLAQMQAYAACDDPDVRDVVRRGFGRLYRFVESVSGAGPEEMQRFFAMGMLCNVAAAMDLESLDEPWARALLPRKS